MCSKMGASSCREPAPICWPTTGCATPTSGFSGRGRVSEEDRRMGKERMPRFAPPRVEVETLAGGGMILRSPLALGAVDRCVGVWLEAWAGRAGERTYLAERAGTGWRTITYAVAHQAARAVGEALLKRQLGPERPILIL